MDLFIWWSRSRSECGFKNYLDVDLGKMRAVYRFFRTMKFSWGTQIRIIRDVERRKDKLDNQEQFGKGLESDSIS